VLDTPKFSDAEITHNITINPYPQVYTTPDGTVLPRVSSIIGRMNGSLALEHMYAQQILDNPSATHQQYNKAKIFIDLHKRRSIIGNQVHERIAFGLNNNTIHDNELIESAELEAESIQKIQFFQAFYKAQSFKLLQAADSRLMSTRLRFSGTPDIVATINNTPQIIDIKTGKETHRSNTMQLIGYKLLVEEALGVRADVAVLLLGHRCKNPKYKKYGSKNTPRYLPPTYKLAPITITNRDIAAFKVLVDNWHRSMGNLEELAEFEKHFYQGQDNPASILNA
jgi:hypothetical protein